MITEWKLPNMYIITLYKIAMGLAKFIQHFSNQTFAKFNYIIWKNERTFTTMGWHYNLFEILNISILRKLINPATHIMSSVELAKSQKTSKIGKRFRITDLLWGLTTGYRCVVSQRGTDADLWCPLVVSPSKLFNNSGVAGDLRRYGAHVTSQDIQLSQNLFPYLLSGHTSALIFVIHDVMAWTLFCITGHLSPWFPFTKDH